MDTPKMITIQEARRSQSGKSLGIRDQEGRWYNSKCWDLEMAVGMTITAMTSESEWQGKAQYWINSYTMPEGQVVQPAPNAPGAIAPNAPAPMAPIPPIQTAVQLPQAPIPAQPTQVDRDASIVAQTLCKTVTFSNIAEACLAYRHAYHWYLEDFVHGRAEAEANEQAQNQGHDGFGDQDIPF